MSSAMSSGESSRMPAVRWNRVAAAWIMPPASCALHRIRVSFSRSNTLLCAFALATVAATTRPQAPAPTTTTSYRLRQSASATIRPHIMLFSTLRASVRGAASFAQRRVCLSPRSTTSRHVRSTRRPAGSCRVRRLGSKVRTVCRAWSRYPARILASIQRELAVFQSHDGRSPDRSKESWFQRYPCPAPRVDELRNLGLPQARRQGTGTNINMRVFPRNTHHLLGSWPSYVDANELQLREVACNGAQGDRPPDAPQRPIGRVTYTVTHLYLSGDVELDALRIIRIVFRTVGRLGQTSGGTGERL